MDWLEILRKFLPVNEFYQDALQPGAKELGQALRDMVKTARLLLGPISYLAAHHDRWERYLKRLSDKVPEADMITVHPQISGPALDGLRYVDENGLIAEMFLNLLARAMDKRRVNEAHPAFVEIIRQLSPDEALILFKLKKARYSYTRKDRIIPRDDSHSPYTQIGELQQVIIDNEFPTSELTFPGNFSIYVEHLAHLDLLVTRPIAHKKSDPDSPGNQVKLELRFTNFGCMFRDACVPDNLVTS